jgi:DNA-binding NarL/FixJ family response regulator
MAGAGGYLLKSDVVTGLTAALESLRTGGAPISPRIARLLVEHLVQPARDEALITPREREVVELFATGATYNEVARILHISVNTVREHVRHLYEKLHVNSKTEAVRMLQKR